MMGVGRSGAVSGTILGAKEWVEGVFGDGDCSPAFFFVSFFLPLDPP